ncbi:MAG: TatD family deoxyribonuclease [Firmicutes bacterium]|nr:TatD family deoxyribonuclease [Bacillota bacterium]
MPDLIDTHAHLNHPRLTDNLDQVLAAAKAAGVGTIINIGYDLSSSHASVELAAIHPCIFAAVGFHPHWANDFSEANYISLKELAQRPEVVAIGEIGLDYFRDNSPREVQRTVFRRQLELVCELKMPVIVHTRDAIGDTVKILTEFGPFVAGGVMHCYSGSAEMVRDFLSLNLSISLGGPVTFKNARRAKEVAAAVPAERLLLETDCPYLAPHPHRGSTNHPAYLAIIAAEVAAIRNTDIDSLADQTSANARKLFNI